jgi:hypothetical protein
MREGRIMMIYDYKTPLGRELRPDRSVKEPSAVTIRYLSDEEKEKYGCENITVIKKICAHCQKEKSDYAFFYSTTSPDGLSHWCRKCVTERQRQITAKQEKHRKSWWEKIYEQKQAETIQKHFYRD